MLFAIEGSGDIDVCVVRPVIGRPSNRPDTAEREFTAGFFQECGIAVAIISLLTAVCWQLEPVVGYTVPALVYLFAILLAAFRLGAAYAVGAGVEGGERLERALHAVENGVKQAGPEFDRQGPAQAVRLFTMGVHYRAPLGFEFEEADGKARMKLKARPLGLAIDPIDIAVHQRVHPLLRRLGLRHGLSQRQGITGFFGRSGRAGAAAPVASLRAPRVAWANSVASSSSGSGSRAGTGLATLAAGSGTSAFSWRFSAVSCGSFIRDLNHR